jgi:transposase-like protein
MFKQRHFDDAIILLCVRWYISYKLSYRDLTEMMFERGLTIAPSTTIAGFNIMFPNSRSGGTRPRQSGG